MWRDVTTSGGPAPGWYDDGSTPDVQRWFDGTAWTEHTRPLPESALPAPRSATRVPGVPVPEAARPAVATSWAPTAGAWLPGDAIPEPETTDTPPPVWVDPAWSGAPAVSRFGTPTAVYAGVPSTTPAVGVTVPPPRTGPDMPPAPARVGAVPLGGFGVDASFGATPAYGSPAALSAAAGPGFVLAAGSIASGAVTGALPTVRQGPPPGAWSPGGWGPASAPAHWGWRVLAYIVDQLIIGAPYTAATLYLQTSAVVGLVPVSQLQTAPGAETLTFAAACATVLLWVVDRIVLQGRTGQSWGKRVVGIRLVREGTGRPLGMWWAFVRDVAYFVNTIPLGLGYLWPLWDPRRQTFTDKLSSSLVLRDAR